MSKSFALVMPKSTFLEDSLVFGPLGLWYLASRLESLGHKVDFYDLNIDPIPADTYSEIWVSATSPQMAEIKRVAKETQGYKAKRILGGPAAWAMPESVLGIGYDLVVGGEADSPAGIQQVLNSEKDYEFIPVSRTLDWALPPSRRWTRKYHSYLKDANGNKVDCTTMFNSRGCPLECGFCESGRHGIIWDRFTRYEPLEMEEEQIKECKELGYNAIAFYDDVKPLNKKRMIKEMEMLQSYKMIWRCFLRSDIICNHGGFDYLKDMRDSGLVEIFVGVESADNEIKNNITKKTTIEQDTLILQWCRELGIRCKMSFIFGLPGESRESMQKTREWILKYRPDRVQVGRLIPFGGTPLTKHPENYDLIYEKNPPDDWFYMGMNQFQESFVSTSKVSRDEIDVAWHSLQKELDELGIPS